MRQTFHPLSLDSCRSSDAIIVSRHNDAALELKLRLGCCVFDDDEMIVESLENDLKYGDGIVVLSDIISFRTSAGVIVDLSSSFNKMFLLRGYHPLSAIACLFFLLEQNYHSMLY